MQFRFNQKHANDGQTEMEQAGRKGDPGPGYAGPVCDAYDKARNYEDVSKYNSY